MDDQDVSPLVGVMALGVILAGLAAVAWLLVDVNQATGGGSGPGADERPPGRRAAVHSSSTAAPGTHLQRCGRAQRQGRVRDLRRLALRFVVAG